MNPGELNTKIIIQQYVTVTDNEGFENQQWQDFKPVWASETGLVGRNFYAAKAVQSESDKVFKIRYTKGITPKMRIVKGKSIIDGKAVYEHIYEIRSDPVDKDGRRKEMYITASEVIAK